MHQTLLDAVDQTMQAYLEKLRIGCRVVIDLQSQQVYYRSAGRRDTLGSLGKRILLMLANESLSGAEIARRLGVWH